ncbi:hypothetical protein [Sediminispirochaeta bajacaliforniensis]|uniref:hypothetical protein n=1 Tax=Sediminispirochaeta bajacaliforniensis TaxID=148 RepID=UPI00036064FF|nr:hypothetical protein [Sediminispirochaeta bajacaliforniensis]
MIRKSVIVATAAVLALLIFAGCSNGTTDHVRPAETYTVTYNANGANSGTVPTDGSAYLAGDEVTVLGNTGRLALDDEKVKIKVQTPNLATVFPFGV